MNEHDENLRRGAKAAVQPIMGQAPAPEECFLYGMRYALKSQWRSVEESLPEDGSVVLIIEGEDLGDYRASSLLHVATFYREWEDEDGLTEYNVFYSNTGCLFMREEITHWMPIPSLPVDMKVYLDESEHEYGPNEYDIPNDE